MQILPMAIQTAYADLVQKAFDAEFDEQFGERGQFVRKVRKEREYWYFQTYVDGKQAQRYVGPVEDPAISERVERHRLLKQQSKDDRKVVRSLLAAGLPSTPPLTADVLDALRRAGIFRLRTVLVGSVAYQAYSGVLGVRLPERLNATGDLDFAQFHGISMMLEDSMPPVLSVLQSVDRTFRAVPHVAGPGLATKFVNQGRFEVEFLTPNTGSDVHQGRPAPMPALSGAGAEPLRFLDFLIHQPIRAVMLHRSGIHVTVPAPARYAVHKLIVAARRRTDPIGALKSLKDVAQAGAIIEAMVATRRSWELAEAFEEASGRGPSWRDALRDGRSRLAPQANAALGEVLNDGALVPPSERKAGTGAAAGLSVDDFGL